MSNEEPKLVAIDEEAKHQIVHRCRCGKANRATHETLDLGAQIDVLAFNLLRMCFANHVLLGIDMAGVSHLLHIASEKGCTAHDTRREMPVAHGRIYVLGEGWDGI